MAKDSHAINRSTFPFHCKYSLLLQRTPKITMLSVTLIWPKTLMQSTGLPFPSIVSIHYCYKEHRKLQCSLLPWYGQRLSCNQQVYLSLPLQVFITFTKNAGNYNALCYLDMAKDSHAINRSTFPFHCKFLLLLQRTLKITMLSVTLIRPKTLMQSTGLPFPSIVSIHYCYKGHQTLQCSLLPWYGQRLSCNQQVYLSLPL